MPYIAVRAHLHAQVRAFLEGLASTLQVPFASAVRLLSRHPSIWERPVDTAAGKVQQLAAALGTGPDEALGLYCSQPILWAINHPSIIKDR